MMEVRTFKTLVILYLVYSRATVQMIENTGTKKD